MRLNLAAKAFLLLSLPLAFQIGLFACLLAIQDHAINDLRRLVHPIEVTSKLSQFLIDAIRLSSFCDGKDSLALLTPEFNELRRDGLDSLTRLQTLLDKEPQGSALVSQLLAQSNDLAQLVDSAPDLLPTETSGNQKKPQDSVLKILTPEFERLASALPEVGNLIEQEVSIAQGDTESLQSDNEEFDRLLRYGVLAETLLLAISLFWFRNDIAKRFHTMIDNSFKMASRQPLNQPVSGNDEIAAIDSTFHNMAKQLAEAQQTEKIILENTRAVVCAVSEKLAFIDVSPASLHVFGYTPDELLQMRVARLFAAGDDPVSLFDGIRSGQANSFELRSWRKDGAPIDTEWSVDWSVDRQQFFCTIHDISDRKNADRLRDEIAHLISSGLQAPLATIGTVLHQIDDAADIPTEQKYLMAAAIYANSQMLMLVRDLIDMEDIESGTLRFKRAVVPLSQIVQQAISVVTGIAIRYGVRVEDHTVAAELYADKDRLTQVLVNLLSNAIKFSKRDSAVRVQAQDCGNAVQLQVIDNGRGIAASDLPTIFDRFQQAEVGDARAKGGSGLGLAICQALVEMHQSKISVSSTESGTTFTFSIAKTTSAPGSGQ